MKTLTRQDMEDLLLGAEILGCGGGGTVASGRKMIAEVLRKGKEFRLADPSEISENELIVIVSAIGGGVPEEILRRVRMLSKIRRA